MVKTKINIRRNATYATLYIAGILSGLSIIWKYPKVYQVMFLVLVVVFIIDLNNGTKKEQNDNTLDIRIVR